MEIEVRRGALDDVDALRPLWLAMVDHHRELAGGQWPIHGSEETWELRERQYRAWLEDQTGLLFLAMQPSAPEPVGYAFCRLLASGPTFDLGPVLGDVESLAVVPAARGAGIGTKLLEACRAALRARGVKYWSIGVVAQNERAEQLYLRLGFRPWFRTLLAPLGEEQ